MKIYLMCVSGITTSIFAGKLNKASKAAHPEDAYYACKIDFFREVIESCDAVIIAPQARVFADRVQEECRKKNIPVMYMDEQTLVLHECETVFRWVEAHRRQNRSESKTLGVTQYIKVIAEALLNTMIVYGLGVLLQLPYKLTGFGFVQPLADVMCQLSGLFFLLNCGYYYAKETGRSILSTTLMFVLGPLIVLPSMSSAAGTGGIMGLSSGILSLNIFGMDHILMLIGVSLTVLLLSEGINHLLKTGSEQNRNVTLYSKARLSDALILLVFLLLRAVITQIL